MMSPENLFIASSAHAKLGLHRLASEFPDEIFTTVTTEEFAARLTDFVKKPRGYRRAVFFTYDFDSSRAILWRGIVWWLSSKGVLLDGKGRKRRASLMSLILRDTPRLLAEVISLPYIFSRVASDLDFVHGKPTTSFPASLSIAYLRTDHWFGTKAGGSVTHIAGVANSFRDLGIPLFFLSSDRLELIDEARTPVVCVRPTKYIQNVPDAPEIAYNLRLIAEGNKAFQAKRPTIIYQRYSQYNYAGAYLAAKWEIPFVLEYNGSEVWIARNWGSPLRFQRWAESIEMANLDAANAIVVVSDPMKDELVQRGVAAQKILVNPNGVDVERFNSERVGAQSQQLRKKLQIADKVVVGFIGTFGKWHGAEVLARTVSLAVRKDPRLHFMFIGDGVTMPQVRRIVADAGVSESVSFTGMVPQDDGPMWLGACDILASPHVANPDGSRFFGSPTKLFEYMAMSRGIVASRLDQIAEVLQHDYTALLVTPGSVEETAQAILTLAADPEKGRTLGVNARKVASERYTWIAHVSRILAHLEELKR